MARPAQGFHRVELKLGRISDEEGLTPQHIKLLDSPTLRKFLSGPSGPANQRIIDAILSGKEQK